MVICSIRDLYLAIEILADFWLYTPLIDQLQPFKGNFRKAFFISLLPFI